MRQLRQLATHVNTQNILLNKLTFLMQEQANITDSFLLWTVKYCQEHNIPIGEEKQFRNLIADSKRIMAEVKITSNSLDELCTNPYPADMENKK